MPNQPVPCLMTFEVERKGAVAIVKCHGRLVSSECHALHVEVIRLMPDHKRIVLDLTDLVQMDSTGLGTLVRLYASSKSRGCELVLLNLGPRVRQLLGMTNLLSVFAIVGERGITIGF